MEMKCSPFMEANDEATDEAKRDWTSDRLATAEKAVLVTNMIMYERDELLLEERERESVDEWL